MKKQIVSAALLTLAVCMASGPAQGELLHGDASAAFGSGVTLSTPAPTKSPNVLPGLGMSQHAPQSTGTEKRSMDGAAASLEEAEVAGETRVYEVNGFAAMKVAVTVDAQGRITRVEVVEHQETPGFGASYIENQAHFDALVGQQIGSVQADAVTGATLTVQGINQALAQAAKDFGAVPEEAPADAGEDPAQESIQMDAPEAKIPENDAMEDPAAEDAATAGRKL